MRGAIVIGLPALKMLPGPFNRKSFLIEQTLDIQNDADIFLRIDAIAGAIFCRSQIGKLGFPVTQNVGLQAGDFTDLADGVIQFFDVCSQGSL